MSHSKPAENWVLNSLNSSKLIQNTLKPLKFYILALKTYP